MIDNNKLISLIDLTSLNTTDSQKSTLSFLRKANNGINGFYPASVCTYSKYADILSAHLNPEIKSCVVSSYFPTSQAPLDLKIKEIEYFNLLKIDEIDIVLPIGEFLDGNSEYVYNELFTIRKATTKKIKLIIESGLLASDDLIAKATKVGLKTGMDFIKTSTGKIGKGVDLNSVIIIAKTIKDFHMATGKLQGIKIAGGIKGIDEAKAYIKAITLILGKEYISPNTFRIGTSTLYDELIKLKNA